MIGKRLTEEFLDAIDTKELSEGFITQKRAYECLDLAAAIYVRETRSLHKTINITTVAEQQEYPLPPDFIDLYMRDNNDKIFLRYTNGDGEVSWPVMAPEEHIYRLDYSEPAENPACFAIVNNENEPALITGAADVAGAAVTGRCILQDNDRLFLTTHRVWPRDLIYNHTDESWGYVLGVIDATHLYTALFSGTNNDWTGADTYTIIPGYKQLLKLDAPSLTAGHTIAVPYVSMPAPVFWELGSWNFPERVCRAIVSGGAALFKTSKTEYKEAESLGALFDAEVKRYKLEMGRKALQAGPSRKRQRM